MFDSDSAPTSVDGYDHAAPHRPDRGIREWLEHVSQPAKHELRSLGFDTSIMQETFRVHGYEGPLLGGELERAEIWADAVLTPIGAASA